MKPVVSILCITYNQSKYIAQALDSFLAQQTDFAFEIIVHDDASTDGTTDILRSYAKKYPDIIHPLYEKKNQYSQKKFEFIKEMFVNAKGKYIAMCEGDDFWTDSHKLQIQVDFLEKNTGHAICFHPTRVFFEDSEENQKIWPKLDRKFKPSTEELLKENFIPSNSVVYRRYEYKDMPIGMMPGDWFVHLYHAQYGKIGYVDRVMSAYRRHSGGVWWDSFKDQDSFWKKYGLPILYLYSELLKIYGNDSEYRQIISKSASETLDRLVESDKRYDSGLVKQAMSEMPDITESGIIYKRQVSQDLQEKVEEIAELNTELLDTRATAFKLRDELHTLHNSRVMGRVIKVRERIGNPYTLPKRSVNKVRRTAAKFVPDSVRLPLMKSLRRTRDGAKQRINHYRYKAASIVTNDNQRWEKNKPLISVVIPYYNRADTIDETLLSLSEQTFRNFEIIVVDDNSSDEESVEKLDQLKDVKVIRHKTNQGVATARNNGIAAAKGKYIICLDSDDMLEETYIEKAALALETNPDISLISAYQDMFGVLNDTHEKHSYDPVRLFEDNMVITAAMFRREAWEQTGGYKTGIGYEDWEFWLTLAEAGHWGKQIPEPLFKYRTSMQSRYVEDKDVHWKNIKAIHSLHPHYKKQVRALIASRRLERHVVSVDSALVNMKDSGYFTPKKDNKPNVLIAMPWMTFGGAETLIYNLCRQTMSEYSVSFVTGLPSKNEWEYKFREISHNIYHLPNLFEDKALYIEFVTNLVKTRNIDILHIIHTDFVFEMLPDLKEKFPHLRVVVTMFNDRVPNYVSGVVSHQEFIDIVTSDNQKTITSFKEKMTDDMDFKVIPNGIDGDSEFNPDLFNRNEERTKLKLSPDDLAVFFVGRLSPEKNPDVFVKAAANILSTHKNKKIKFFIIGDGPMRNEINKQLKAIHSDGITHLGYQSEVARYLSAADIFVLPSSIEGFPLSILEAMAMKVVVIASRVGAIPDVIENGHNGFIIEPGSVDEIEEVLLELDVDRKRVDMIKATERDILEKTYSHKQLGHNYRSLYKEALS